MTVAMPDPIPLHIPRDDSGALADLVRAIAAAAYSVAAVDDRLLGAASSAPGWLGDDAAAAAAQVGAVTTLVRDVSSALPPAIGRLESHAELLLETRRRVGALVAEQDHEFADAWRRLGQVESLRAQVMTDGAEVRAIVDGVQAGEVSRRRRHTALIEELEDDARATARVLANACAAIGGRGTPGDANLVVAYLAARLPGWGDLELARRAQALAALLHDPDSADEAEEASLRAAVFAAMPTFADALLTELGERGFAELLLALGARTFGDDLDGASSAVARLVAAALGAAGQGAVDRIGQASLVDPEEEGTTPDLVAMGMSVVLVARVANGGPAPMTVASWMRQVLARESALAGSPEGARAVDRVYPNSQYDPIGDENSLRNFDPVPVLATWLAEHGTAAAAASALSERESWTVLLNRSWDDGAADLAHVVSLAAAHPGAAGARAAWSGLASIGGGLTEGDPSLRTVDRGVVDRVAPDLGAAVAAHPSVVTSSLTDLGRGELPDDTREVARGLGYLMVDGAASDAVVSSLRDWALVQPRELAGSTVAAPSPVIAVPSTLVAVQQFGQRLAHALDAYEAEEAALLRQRWWEGTVGLAVNFVPGPAGVAVGVLEGLAAIELDMDGTWDDPIDHRVVLDAVDAARASLDGMEPTASQQGVAVAGQARAAYDRAIDLLGRPRPPISPPHDYLEVFTGGLSDLAWEEASRRPGAPKWLNNSLVSLFR